MSPLITFNYNSSGISEHIGAARQLNNVNVVEKAMLRPGRIDYLL